MGNYTSRCFIGHSSKKTAKLIDTQGNLKKINVPVKAAEIMLEEPGHVISPVDELRKTRRISAMKADDELFGGKVYMLVPVGRVHSKVNESEMVIMDSCCSKKRSSRRKRSGAKVLPAVIEEVREEGESEIKIFGEKDMGFSGYRLGAHRQWNPVLEPISEVY